MSEAWPPPPRFDREGDPYAEVTRAGRFSWWISIHHGILQWGPDGGRFSYFGSEAGARAKAERLLDRYARTQIRSARTLRIDIEDPGAIRRALEQEAASAQALAELRDPEAAWDRQLALLEAQTTRRRRLFRRS